MPIVASTLEVLTKGDVIEQDEEVVDASTCSDKEKTNGDVPNAEDAEESVDPKPKETNDSEVKLRQMISLCLAYAANIGGTGSLIGTPPNLLLADALDEYDGQPINFLSWMGLALPQVCQSYLLKL